MKLFSLSLFVMLAVAFMERASIAQIVASDNADNSPYTAPNGWYVTGDGSGQPASNGGFGFGPWQQFGIPMGTGEHAFIETGPTRVAGNQSFAIDSSDGDYTVYRPLLTPIAVATFDVSLRVEVPRPNGTNGANFNIDSGNHRLVTFQVGSPGDYALAISDPSNANAHIVNFSNNDSGVVGDVLNISVGINSYSGTYVLNAIDETNGDTAAYSGPMFFKGAPLDGFDVSMGGDEASPPTEELVFDSITVTAPEPSALCMTLLGTLGLALMRVKTKASPGGL